MKEEKTPSNKSNSKSTTKKTFTKSETTLALTPAATSSAKRTTRSFISTNMDRDSPSANPTPGLKKSAADQPYSKNKKKAYSRNEDTHVDLTNSHFSSEESTVNKLWEEGLGCREHINEYDDSHQTFMSMYTFKHIDNCSYLFSFIFISCII